MTGSMTLMLILMLIMEGLSGPDMVSNIITLDPSHWAIKGRHHPFFVTTSPYMFSGLPGRRSRYLFYYIFRSSDCISDFEAKGQKGSLLYFNYRNTLCFAHPVLLLDYHRRVGSHKGGYRRFLRCLFNIKV